jgi:competence protein ComFB
MPLDIHHYIDDLKNTNEKRVWLMLSDFIENNDNPDLCLCPICVIDIAAITLNNIPPHYQTEENITDAQARVPDAEIYEQLKKAVYLVSKRPHH